MLLGSFYIVLKISFPAGDFPSGSVEEGRDDAVHSYEGLIVSGFKQDAMKA